MYGGLVWDVTILMNWERVSHTPFGATPTCVETFAKFSESIYLAHFIAACPHFRFRCSGAYFGAIFIISPSV